MPDQKPFYSRGLLLLVWLLGAGCNRPQPAPEPIDRRNGYRPVYAALDTPVPTITTRAPQPLQRPGRIYIRDGYLFVNEQNKGLHVIDNRDPAHPVALAFIDIPGNTNMALKDTTLYVNSGINLLALNISDPAHVRLAKRLDNILPTVTPYPSVTNVWFECVDPAKGVLVGWEPAQLTNPACYR